MRLRIISEGTTRQRAVWFLGLLGLVAMTASADEIAARRLRIGFPAKMGFNEYQTNGIRSGFCYEYLQNLALYCNFTYDYLGYDKSWAQNLEMLERGEIDLLPGALISDERLKKFDCSFPIANFMSVLSVKAGDARFPRENFQEWNGIRVGMARAVIHNDNFAAFAQKKHFIFVPVWFEDYRDLGPALAAGKVDAIITDSFRRGDGEWILEMFDQMPARILIRKGQPQLLADLNEAIERLNRNQPDLTRLLRNEYFASRSMNGVFFARDELDFIAKAQEKESVFTVAINPDRPPYSFVRNGNLVGIQKDIGDRIFKMTGLRFTWIISPSRPAYTAFIDEGKADVIMSSRYSYGEAEKRGYAITQPYLSPALSFLKRRDHKGPIRSIALYTDTGFRNQVQQHFGHSIRMNFYPTTRELSQAVMNGADDCSLMYSEVAEGILRNDHRNVLIHEVAPGFFSPFRVAIRRQAGEKLVPILSKAVANISANDVAEITQRYLNEELLNPVTPIDLYYADPSLYSWILSGALAALLVILGWIIVTRRHSYEKLRELNDRTAAMLREQTVTLNSIGDGVLVTDAEGRVRMLNPIAARITGFTRAEADGLRHDQILKTVSNERGEPVASPIKQALESGQVSRPSHPTDLVTREGRRIPIEEIAAPITDEEGKTSGVILVFRDITEEAAQRTRLRQAYAQLEAGTRLSKSATFVYNPASNEISGSSMLPKLLPILHGYLVTTIDRWVYPDDQPQVHQLFATLDHGEASSVQFDYRHQGRKGLEYYRMQIDADRSVPERILYTGVVQNVTNLKLTFEKMAEQQNLWQLAINLLPLMLYVKDASDNFRNILCNKALANFIGKQVGDINGKSEYEFYPVPTCDLFRKQDERIMASGKGEEFDEVAYDSAGHFHHLHTIKTPYTNATGRRLLIGVSTDTSEITDLAGGLQVMNSCLEMLCTETDIDKAIHQALSAICRHIGAMRSYILQFDLVKRTCSTYTEYFPAGMAPAVSGIKDRPYSTTPSWADYFQTHESILIEDVARNGAKQGLDPTWLAACAKFNARSLFSNRILLNGKLWGYIGLAFDNANRRPTPVDAKFIASVARFIETLLMRQQQQAQLLSALEQAKAADRAKSYFIASVSHEIRTPLNAVIGFSELLREGHVSAEDEQDYLESITVSGNALLQIINDVLDLSKLEANQMDILPEPIDFKAIGKESMRIFQQRAMSRQIALEVNIPELPLLCLDKLRIRQILFNLIGNAVKFTFTGSVTLAASWKPLLDNTGEFQFAVRDTGIGISDEDQAKLMVPFVQLSKVRGTSAATNGTGLGLSICKRLAEKMGGKLWIQSKPGQGSTFGITLYHVVVGTAPTLQSVDTVAQTVAPQELSVLLVDDVPMNLKVMEALCKKAGVTDITAVNSGRAALDVLEKRNFSLILTDLWMPGMNGAELAQRIRSIPRFQSQRILAVTADVEAKGSFPMSAFTGTILKPVTLEKIRALLCH